MLYAIVMFNVFEKYFEFYSFINLFSGCDTLCDNNICMHPDWKCNGVNDCGDFTDERNCASVPIPPEVKDSGCKYAFRSLSRGKKLSLFSDNSRNLI